MDRRLARLQ